MTWDEIFKLVFAFFASTSIASVIIFGLANWLGKIWAKRINDEYKLKLDKEIECYKSELERVRNDYQRFASKKFIIIEEIWSSMNSIVDELTIYNPINSGDYQSYLFELMNKITKYSRIINKNSLYFNDEIQKLLNDYISVCVDVNHLTSEELRNNTGDIKKIRESIIKIVSKASEREEILKKIKVEFKKELGFN